MHAAVRNRQTNRFKGGLRLRLMKTYIGWATLSSAGRRSGSRRGASARLLPLRSWLEQFKLAKALLVGDVSDRQPQVDAPDLWRVRLLELFHPVRNLLAVAGADAFFELADCGWALVGRFESRLDGVLDEARRGAQ